MGNFLLRETESFFGQSVLAAVLWSIGLGFGLVVVLKFIQHENPLQGYKTLLIGDLLGLPLLIGTAVHSMSDREWDDVPWIRSGAFLAIVLIAWYAASIAVEVLAMKSGTFTMQDELKLSKLAHTIISLPILGYLATASVIILITEGILTAQFLVGLVGGLVWVATMVWDGAHPPANPSLAI